MLAALLASCSLTTLRPTPCTTNTECRDAFGWGWTCDVEQGLCEDNPLPPRCDRTIPANLWERRDEYADAIVLGSVYERQESIKDVQSFELAIAQVNDGDGFDGHPYALVQCSNEDDTAFDDLTHDEANVEMATFLADTVGVPAILGPSYSSATEAAFQTVEPFGTLVISPSATSPALTALDGLDHSDADPGLLWRTAPPDSLQGQAIALDMQAREIHDATVIYQTGPYGEGLAEVFIQFFDGDTTLLLFDNPSVRDTYTADTATTNTEEVLFISSDKADVTAFLNAAGQVSGYETKGLFLADAAYDTAVLTAAESSSALFPNIRGTRPTTPAGPVYDTFLAAFAAAYGGESAADSGFTAYAYDAAWLTIYGTAWSLDRTGEVSGLGIASGLRRVSDGTEVLIRPTSWNTVKATFADADGVDVVGASGQLDYDSHTEETVAPIDVWTVNAAGDGFVVQCTFTPPAYPDPAACAAPVP